VLPSQHARTRACKELGLDAAADEIDLSGRMGVFAGPGATATALDALARRNLTALDVSGAGVGPEACDALAAALRAVTRLVRLRAARNPVGPQGAAALGRAAPALTALHTLDLTACGIHASGLKAGRPPPAARRPPRRCLRPGGARRVVRDGAFGRRACLRDSTPPPLPPPRTKWTRRVPHPVLIGHAASLTPYRGCLRDSTRCQACGRSRSRATASATRARRCWRTRCAPARRCRRGAWCGANGSRRRRRRCCRLV
jgi:hypothetical protein